MELRLVGPGETLKLNRNVEKAPVAEAGQLAIQWQASKPRCCTPRLPSTAENSWKASLNIIWGRWYWEPISSTGLVGSACGEVGMASPGEVWQEGETGVSWQCEVMWGNVRRGLENLNQSTYSRWILHKGEHCRQHSRGSGQSRVRGGRVGRACRSWWRKSRPPPAASPAATTTTWRRWVSKGCLVSTGDQHNSWFTGEDSTLSSPENETN